ncbi:MAG: RNA polymerase sigma factor, partial [Clostridia bacterium]|nr:RNA polymerase sigma factor [Clostridia bacterium]
MEKEKLISIVCAAQNGDQEAAAELYNAFHSDIYYHILKNVNNDAELAADLTQEAFIEILQTIDKLQEPAAFVTWAQRIAYHQCTAYFRKRREILLDESEDGYSVFDTIEEDRSEFIPGESLEKEELRCA